jgi:uncharacterized DUF497 family protein
MAIKFRWNEWNEAKLNKHGVAKWEAEHVVLNARRPYPKSHRNGTWLAIGRGQGDRPLEVVYVEDEYDREMLFIIHSMPLTTRRRRG